MHTVRALFAISTIVFVQSFALEPANAAETDPYTLDALVETYGAGAVPADLLIVVDTSSSMIEDGKPPPWPGVAKGYDALVDAVGPSDRLGLITFDSTAAIRLDPTVLRNAKQRQMAKNQLPKRPKGQNTDIGAGLDAAIGRLSRGGASEIQTLVFITDGRHNPSASSKFPDKTGGSWNRLKRESDALVKSRRGRLNVYGWGQGVNGSDIALVQDVFPDAQILAIPTQQLSAFLASLATDAQRARVRPDVRADLDKSVESELIVPDKLDPQMQATLRVTNPRTGLPTDVKLEGLEVTEVSGQKVPVELPSQDFSLNPGQSVDIPVTISPQGTDHGLITLGEQVDERSWDVEVNATSSLNEDLTSLLVNERLATEKQTRSPVESPGKVDASRDFGLAWRTFFLLLALLIAAIVALAYTLRWMFIPPPLSGLLVDVHNEPLLRLTGREVTIPNASVGNPESADAFRLFTKPRGRGRRVWIQQVAGNPRVRNDVLGRRPRRLFGRDRIVVGGDEMTYVGKETK